MRRRPRLLLAWALCLGALLVAPSAAAAEPFGLANFDVTFTTGPAGEEATQAGSHPFQMETSFTLNTKEVGGNLFAAEPLKDLEVTQIPGFIGNPDAVPRCSAADFLTPRENAELADVPSCSDSSAIGLVSVESLINGKPGEPRRPGEPVWSPVYDLEPPPGVPASFGFWTANVPVTLDVGVSEAFPNNLVAHVRNISQLLEVTGSRLLLWGVPADPAHNSLRGFCAGGKGAEPTSFGSCTAGVAEKPFLTLPRSCTGPLRTEYEADSWEHPGVFPPSARGFAETHNSLEPPTPEGMSGCARVGFSPEVSIEPTTSEGEASSGLDIEIKTKDEGLASAKGIAEADIAATRFAFPAGMTLNPSAAEGLGVCTKAQFEAESLANHGCPGSSKLGSLEVDTPVLENHTLKGAVFLAQQDNPETTEPGAENPFDSLFAAYLVIRDPGLGVFVKLPSRIETDERSGQIVASVSGMPPFPLSRVSVHLRSGPRAPFITPPACGEYSTEASLTPSTGALRTIHPSFHVASGPGGAPCPGAAAPFAPAFNAGTANNAASQYSPFSMRITRQDGEQDITRFSATLPPGVVGKIAGVAQCPDAAIEAARSRSGRAELAAPSCPSSSLVGHVLAGAGVGTALTYVPGSLYLAGPYHGAPLSVAAIVPAVAGPFDVGTVVTRVGLALNPTSGQVEIDGASSDPIPHILKGIPLQVRELRVSADRPDFTLNATNCKPLATAAQIFGSGADVFNSADDTSASASARYQAASCASLKFGPKLALSLKGGTRRAQHPALHSTVTYPYPSGPGYANIAKAVVTLPGTEYIDNAHINNPCTRVQFNEGKCPPSSVLGTARAVSPLLDEPLEGPVYFRSNGSERLLPDIVADLRGQFHIVLVGFVKTITPKTDPRLQTTFATVPDAPVKSFKLNLFGGKRGLLVNNTNLCAKPRHLTVELTAQNGKRHDSTPVVGTSCKGKGKRSGH